MDRLRKRGAFIALVVLVCFLMTGCSFIQAGKDRVEALILGNDAEQQLHTALMEGNFEAMCEAEEQGADLDTLPDPLSPNPLLSLLTRTGYSSFRSADQYGNLLHLEYAQYLLEKGADPNWCNDQGYTLVMYCCEHQGIVDPEAWPQKQGMG